MKYQFYLSLKIQDDKWVKLGEGHDILWDNRDLIKASSGWMIVNQEKLGAASDFVPKLRRGIYELTYSTDNYRNYELDHGLGTIKNVLHFYEELLTDCKEFPFTQLCGGINN